MSTSDLVLAAEREARRLAEHRLDISVDRVRRLLDYVHHGVSCAMDLDRYKPVDERTHPPCTCGLDDLCQPILEELGYRNVSG